MDDAPTYAAFGERLAGLRTSRDMDQTTLAKALGCSQQSVSRWESGRSRPKPRDIASIANLFDIKNQIPLLQLAGYATGYATGHATAQGASALSFDRPFPMDQLSPESFERFIAYVLALRHPDAKVMRAGTSGHEQDGIDITVTFPNGDRHSFQCKRVLKFGPADVHRAINAHTANAQKKHLVLSRVASPQTADALRGAKDWELWDKETISQLIRTRLPQDDQIRLVDIFFQGQREALLGLPEASAWMTLEEFYRPLSQRENAFNHTWRLQGREKEVSELTAALWENESPVVLLIGAAGMGKSRILKEVFEQGKQESSGVATRFLSTAAELSREKLELLGKGKKILAVDDAHDRDKLSILLEHAAANPTNTKVLLSTRPYAEARILREAAVYGLAEVPRIVLARLSKANLLKVIQEALPPKTGAAWAEPIASISGDSPLVAIMAAKIVAREGIAPEMAKNDEQLRHLILGKFKNVLAGELDARGDPKLVAATLDVLSLIQPFHIEDPQLIELLRLVTSAEDAEISRALALLVTGGVLFKRGHQYRLMPDLLGDYLIEESCIDHAGQLSAFARKIVKEIPPSLLTNALVNLGRLDWRRSKGDPAESNLLEAMWRTLDDITDQYDPRFEAIRAVAVFQPHQALKFVEDRLRQRKPLREATKIIRNVAFNRDYIERACELLWEMGRNDTRELGQFAEHPVRVLAEMAGFEERKPLNLIQPVFEFGMGLLDRESAWKGHLTPLDVLKPVLGCEGVTTIFKGRNLIMSPFMVDYDVVAPLRLRLINRLISLLTDSRPAVAAKVARFLQSAIHGPRGNMGARVPEVLEKKFADEAVQTLKSVVSAMKNNRLHPAVYINLATAIHWMARHRDGELGSAAQAVLAALPCDLKFRVQTALSDGFGQIFFDMTDAGDLRSNVEKWIGGLVLEVRAAHPDPRERLEFVSSAVDELTEADGLRHSVSSFLLELLRGDADFARVIISEASTNSKSTAGTCVWFALLVLLQHSPTEARTQIKKFLEGSDSDLAQSATKALSGEMPPRTPEDIALLDRAFASADPLVVQQAFHVAMGWQHVDPHILIAMTKRVRLDLHPRLVQEFGITLAGASNRLLLSFSRDDALHFLKQIRLLPNLEDYWLQEIIAYLSYNFPHELAEFFFERVELAATPERFNEVRPANYGPYSHKPMRFTESPEAGAILAKTWAWLRKNEDRTYHFQYHAADLFDAMFITSNGNTVSDEMVGLFESRIESASPVELKLMARILRHADNGFVFSHRGFVMRLLNRCRDADPDVLQFMINELIASAVSGVRGGIIGEPAPEDVNMLDAAKRAMTEVPRLSPAFDLYQSIYETSQWSIRRSRADAEALDDEDT